MKVALLSSYTTEFLMDDVRRSCTERNIRIDTVESPFGQYREQIVNPGSELRKAQPDVLILMLRGEDLLALEDELIDLISEAERRFPSAAILIHNGVLFDPIALPMLSANLPDSPGARISALNARLHDVVAASKRVRILDLAALFLRHGTDRLLDPRMMYLAKYPFSTDGTRFVAEQITAALASSTGARCKCIVLDLDNTLWGGVLGEDGPTGILLSDDGPGKAYHDFQRALLRIQQTGVLLAICSKNDEAPALEVIRNHPGMVLRPEHFAAWKINWDPKPKNLAALAEELNLGLNSFLLIDDSAQEREFVRQALPGVNIRDDFPAEPAELPAFATSLRSVDALSITDSDRKRTETYAQERKRKDAQSSFGSLDEYIQSLGIRITISNVNDYTVARAAQLTQRTNQFNLTTRRYTEAEIETFRKRKDAFVLLASAKDRFGDAGIVGAAIVILKGQEAHLDTYLLSCRVLGRRIEDAFLAAVLQLAADKGARACVADFIPTERNAVAKDFLSKQGFQPEGGHFRLALAGKPAGVPGIEVIHG